MPAFQCVPRLSLGTLPLPLNPPTATVNPMPASIRAASLLGLCFFSVVTATAAIPVVERLQPLGVERGQEVTVTFVGQRLKDAHQVLVRLPGIEVLSVTPIDNNKVEVKLKTDPKLAPGLYPLQLVTKDGIANLRLLAVGAMPVITEKEPNNDFDAAEKIEMNRTVEGVITSEDVDHFQVTLKAGEKLNVEIEGIRLAFSLNNQNILDPYIAILNSGRFEVASSDDSPLLQQDGVCTFTAPEDGEYTVLVRDSAFAGNPICGYRLHIGNFPRPIAVIPGGGTPGAEFKAQLVNVDGTISEASVQLPGEPHEQWPLSTETATGVSPSPNFIRVNELPVVTEAEPNDDYRKAPTAAVPAAFCGLLQAEGDYDCFGFEAKKGTKYRVQVFAREVLRSPVDAVLSVFGPDSKTIQSADDARGNMDPFLEFTAAADGQHVVRIYDHLRGGGPTHHYRIEVTTTSPSVTMSLKEIRRDEAFVTLVPKGGTGAQVILATRGDFGGAFNIAAEGLPPGVTATTFPMPDGRAEIPVLYTATPEAAHAASLMTLTASGENPLAFSSGFDQSHKLVLGQNRRHMFAYKSDRAPIAVTDAAPFKIELIQPKTPIIRDGSKDLVVRIVRNEGFDDAVSLRALYNPPGVGVNNSRKINKGETEVSIPITANGGAAVGKWPIVLLASYNSGNGTSEIATPAIMLDIQAQLFKYTFPLSAGELGSEATVTLPMEVLREYTGESTVELVGLPKGVTSNAAVQKITPESTAVSFPIQIAADAKDGSHKTIACISRVVVDGETIVQTVGTGELRVDKPLPPKVDAPPAKPAETKPAEPAKPAAPKPLSRLEQLRQMKVSQ